MRRMEKRGYEFTPEFKSELKERSARSLAQIKTNYLYKHSRYIDMSTGEIMSGMRGRSAERSAAAKKGAKTKRTRKRDEEKYPDIRQTILYNLEELLRRLNLPAPEYGITREGKKAWKPADARSAATQGKQKLANLLEEVMGDEESRQALADRVERRGQEISDLIDVIEYSRYKEEVNISVAKVAEILSPTGLDFTSLEDYAQDEGWYETYRYSSSIDPSAYDLYEDEE